MAYQDLNAKAGKIQLKRAFANVAASQTDSNIVSAVAGKIIEVLAVLGVGVMLESCV